MKKIQGIDGKTKERAALKKAWLFAVLTSALVTLTVSLPAFRLAVLNAEQ